MNESEYRTIAHVHSQERIRGAVWRLVRRSVQSALYGLSDALKDTVTGKVEGWDVAKGELGVCASELGWIKMQKFGRNFSGKSSEKPLFMRNITDVNSSTI